jgi:hypothetical protein
MNSKQNNTMNICIGQMLAVLAMTVVCFSLCRERSAVSLPMVRKNGGYDRRYSGAYRFHKQLR